MMLSHYFIALGSLPQRLPQQRAAGTKKACLLGPISPPPESIVGSTGTLMAAGCVSLEVRPGAAVRYHDDIATTAAQAILDRAMRKPTQWIDVI